MIPPRKNAVSTPTMYISPMRLWSMVRAQERKPLEQLR